MLSHYTLVVHLKMFCIRASCCWAVMRGRWQRGGSGKGREAKSRRRSFLFSFLFRSMRASGVATFDPISYIIQDDERTTKQKESGRGKREIFLIQFSLGLNVQGGTHAKFSSRSFIFRPSEKVFRASRDELSLSLSFPMFKRKTREKICSKSHIRIYDDGLICNQHKKNNSQYASAALAFHLCKMLAYICGRRMKHYSIFRWWYLIFNFARSKKLLKMIRI